MAHQLNSPGSHLECAYGLLSYGLTAGKSGTLPFDEQGNIDVKGCVQRLDAIREDERSMITANPFVIVPTSADVTLGRGFPYRESSVRFCFSISSASHA